MTRKFRTLIKLYTGLYQKIDPKVRAARRKKFFGTGRKKRQIPDDILEKIYEEHDVAKDESEEKREGDARTLG